VGYVFPVSGMKPLTKVFVPAPPFCLGDLTAYPESTPVGGLAGSSVRLAEWLRQAAETPRHLAERLRQLADFLRQLAEFPGQLADLLRQMADLPRQLAEKLRQVAEGLRQTTFAPGSTPFEFR